MKIKLTSGEILNLQRIKEKYQGRSGFQNMIWQLWVLADDDTGELQLSFELMERINRYAFGYGNATWRKELREVFRRTLGANLDRGLRLSESHD